MKRIPELDGVRALAIALVIGCHYRAFATSLGGWPELGWLGVDVFFVLSGYLITSILLGLKNAERPFARFYSRRCIRILPPLALALLAIAIACAMTGDRSFFTLRSLVRNGLFLQAVSSPRFLLHPHLPSFRAVALSANAPGISGPLSDAAGPLWSLSIEEYFYLLWAPVVLCLERRSVLRVALFICVAEIAMRALFFRGRSDYFSIYMRFDTLIYGALVALFFEQLRVRRWVYRLAMAASGVLLALVLWTLRPVVGLEIRDSPVFMVLGLPLVSIFFAAWVGFLASRSGSGGPVERILRTGPMRGLGRISYTAYLMHVLLYLCIVRVLGETLEAAVLGAVATICVATLSWRLVEAPLLSGRVAFPVRRRPVTEA